MKKKTTTYRFSWMDLDSLIDGNTDILLTETMDELWRLIWDLEGMRIIRYNKKSKSYSIARTAR